MQCFLLGLRQQVVPVEDDTILRPQNAHIARLPGAGCNLGLSDLQESALQETENLVREEAQELLARETQRLRNAGLSESGELRIGHPAEEIVRAAEQLDSDCVIVGSHGMSGVKRFLLGSVSDHVLQYAPCSVLIVKKLAPAGDESRQAAAPAEAGRTQALRMLLALMGNPPVRFVLWNGEQVPATGSPECRRLLIHDRQTLWQLVINPDLHFGDAYSRGALDIEGDLTSFIELINRARRHTSRQSPLLGAFLSRRNHARANTLAGSRSNIHHHYDIGNAFYRLWLDDTMTYSSAIFETGQESLERAQTLKYASMVDQIGAKPGDHVLEIGCGWGGFAEVAALEYGCQVTGLTLSTEQAEYARQRMARLGLERRVEIRLEDYRDALGAFDAIVSIEMLEAVGHRFLGGFFAACERLLAPAGRMALQVITIPDQLYERYRHGTDWIRRYIFPGGHLPSLGALQTAMARSSRFTVERLDDIAAAAGGVAMPEATLEVGANLRLVQPNRL